jgi:hypothetical protein
VEDQDLVSAVAEELEGEPGRFRVDEKVREEDDKPAALDPADDIVERGGGIGAAIGVE